jgi:hypothetical protein
LLDGETEIAGPLVANVSGATASTVVPARSTTIVQPVGTHELPLMEPRATATNGLKKRRSPPVFSVPLRFTQFEVPLPKHSFTT